MQNQNNGNNMIAALGEPIYTRRVVCFLDILGFQDHINKSVSDPDYARYVLEALRHVVSMVHDGTEGIVYDRRCTVFSDSIVISYDSSGKGVSFWILLELIHVMIAFTSHGFFYRGGVTVGLLYHDDQIIFGPAMNEAYRLESKVAKYPRVIVSEDVFHEAAKNPYQDTAEMELEYLLDLIKQDPGDGLFFLDFLSQRQEIDDDEQYAPYLDKVRQLLQENLALAVRNGNGPVQEKYNWFIKYFNEVVKAHGLDDLAI